MAHQSLLDVISDPDALTRFLEGEGGNEVDPSSMYESISPGPTTLDNQGELFPSQGLNNLFPSELTPAQGLVQPYPSRQSIDGGTAQQNSPMAPPAAPSPLASIPASPLTTIPPSPAMAQQQVSGRSPHPSPAPSPLQRPASANQAVGQQQQSAQLLQLKASTPQPSLVLSQQQGLVTAKPQGIVQGRQVVLQTSQSGPPTAKVLPMIQQSQPQVVQTPSVQLQQAVGQVIQQGAQSATQLQTANQQLVLGPGGQILNQASKQQILQQAHLGKQVQGLPTLLSAQGGTIVQNTGVLNINVNPLASQGTVQIPAPAGINLAAASGAAPVNLQGTLVQTTQGSKLVIQGQPLALGQPLNLLGLPNMGVQQVILRPPIVHQVAQGAQTASVQAPQLNLQPVMTSVRLPVANTSTSSNLAVTHSVVAPIICTGAQTVVNIPGLASHSQTPLNMVSVGGQLVIQQASGAIQNQNVIFQTVPHNQVPVQGQVMVQQPALSKQAKAVGSIAVSTPTKVSKGERMLPGSGGQVTVAAQAQLGVVRGQQVVHQGQQAVFNTTSSALQTLITTTTAATDQSVQQALVLNSQLQQLKGLPTMTTGLSQTQELQQSTLHYMPVSQSAQVTSKPASVVTQPHVQEVTKPTTTTEDVDILRSACLDAAIPGSQDILTDLFADTPTGEEIKAAAAASTSDDLFSQFSLYQEPEVNLAQTEQTNFSNLQHSNLSQTQQTLIQQASISQLQQTSHKEVQRINIAQAAQPQLAASTMNIVSNITGTIVSSNQNVFGGTLIKTGVTDDNKVIQANQSKFIANSSHGIHAINNVGISPAASSVSITPSNSSASLTTSSGFMLNSAGTQVAKLAPVLTKPAKIRNRSGGSKNKRPVVATVVPHDVQVVDLTGSDQEAQSTAQTAQSQSISLTSSGLYHISRPMMNSSASLEKAPVTLAALSQADLSGLPAVFQEIARSIAHKAEQSANISSTTRPSQIEPKPVVTVSETVTAVPNVDISKTLAVQEGQISSTDNMMLEDAIGIGKNSLNSNMASVGKSPRTALLQNASVSSQNMGSPLGNISSPAGSIPPSQSPMNVTSPAGQAESTSALGQSVSIGQSSMTNPASEWKQTTQDMNPTEMLGPPNAVATMKSSVSLVQGILTQAAMKTQFKKVLLGQSSASVQLASSSSKVIMNPAVTSQNTQEIANAMLQQINVAKLKNSAVTNSPSLGSTVFISPNAGAGGSSSTSMNSPISSIAKGSTADQPTVAFAAPFQQVPTSKTNVGTLPISSGAGMLQPASSHDEVAVVPGTTLHQAPSQSLALSQTTVGPLAQGAGGSSAVISSGGAMQSSSIQPNVVCSTGGQPKPSHSLSSSPLIPGLMLPKSQPIQLSLEHQQLLYKIQQQLRKLLQISNRNPQQEQVMQGLVNAQQKILTQGRVAAIMAAQQEQIRQEGQKKMMPAVGTIAPVLTKAASVATAIATSATAAPTMATTQVVFATTMQSSVNPLLTGITATVTKPALVTTTPASSMASVMSTSAMPGSTPLPTAQVTPSRVVPGQAVPNAVAVPSQQPMNQQAGQELVKQLQTLLLLPQDQRQAFLQRNPKLLYKLQQMQQQKLLRPAAPSATPGAVTTVNPNSLANTPQKLQQKPVSIQPRPAVITRPVIPARPVAPPVISKKELFKQQVLKDQNAALKPDTKTKFRSRRDACWKLLRYHVYQERQPTEQERQQDDELYEAKCEELLTKYKGMLNKYQYLLLNESMRQSSISEVVMLERLFIQHEKLMLEEDRRTAKLNPELFVPRPAPTRKPSPPPLEVTDLDKGGENKTGGEVKAVPVRKKDPAAPGSKTLYDVERRSSLKLVIKTSPHHVPEYPDQLEEKNLTKEQKPMHFKERFKRKSWSMQGNSVGTGSDGEKTEGEPELKAVKTDYAEVKSEPGEASGMPFSSYGESSVVKEEKEDLYDFEKSEVADFGKSEVDMALKGLLSEPVADRQIAVSQDSNSSDMLNSAPDASSSLMDALSASESKYDTQSLFDFEKSETNTEHSVSAGLNNGLLNTECSSGLYSSISSTQRGKGGAGAKQDGKGKVPTEVGSNHGEVQSAIDSILGMDEGANHISSMDLDDSGAYTSTLESTADHSDHGFGYSSQDSEQMEDDLDAAINSII